MTHPIVYIVFGVAILLALILDLGFLSKKNRVMSMKKAIVQTFFWIIISLGFSLFIWHEAGEENAIRYVSAYLLEWSLSIDNIFVFIIIFNFFKVSGNNHSRVLLMGILMAILFRIVFITVGSELVSRFSWMMYIFGAFLLFTGFKMFKSNDNEDSFDPEHSWAFRLMKKYFRTTNEEPDGKFFLKRNGKTYLTKLSMVVIMLGLIDVVFAVDSIPAVFSIIPNPDEKLLIYSSNIFAVLGLRSLFFLLQGAAKRFDYLQQGIAIVLLFIGAKMLLKEWMHIPAWAALMVILVSIGGSVLYSVFRNNASAKTKN